MVDVDKFPFQIGDLIFAEADVEDGYCEYVEVVSAPRNQGYSTNFDYWVFYGIPFGGEDDGKTLGFICYPQPDTVPQWRWQRW